MIKEAIKHYGELKDKLGRDVTPMAGEKRSAFIDAMKKGLSDREKEVAIWLHEVHCKARVGMKVINKNHICPYSELPEITKKVLIEEARLILNS